MVDPAGNQPASHPETAAVCAQPQYTEWMRQHRGSMWDYTIESENGDVKQGVLRRKHAARLCKTCPLMQKCLTRHDQIVAENLRKMRNDPNYVSGVREKDALVPGVWGGQIFSDRISEHDPIGQTSFMPRNDLRHLAA